MRRCISKVTLAPESASGCSRHSLPVSSSSRYAELGQTPGGVRLLALRKTVRFRMGRESSRGRRTRRDRDGSCDHLRGRHIVVGSHWRERRPADHTGGCSDWLERLRDTGHRAAIFRQYWFEHSIPEFGESQGMLACGFVMVDLVDPSRQTDVVKGYSYRQIITRPILGGGFMTALAVPLIDRIGLPAFTIATAAVTGALIAWGIKRVGQGRRALSQSN